MRHDPKGKIVQNGKIDKNPTGSSHGEQLEPKRLTLININLWEMVISCSLSFCWPSFLLFAKAGFPIIDSVKIGFSTDAKSSN